MRLRVVNPNTTAAMTARIGACAAAVAAPGTTVTAVNPASGPASIESHYDEALAVPGVLAEIAAGEREGVDGYVIACFGDPGLDAARELATGPVVGVAEAAMRTASYLGRGFSVVTSVDRTRGRAEDLARRYGVAAACRGVRACRVPVLALEDPSAEAAVLAECRRALDEDGSDVIVLGCAGMADLCARLGAALGVPVVDGVTAALKQVESLVALGLATSAREEFAMPGHQHYRGALAGYEIDVRPPVGV